MNVLILHSEDAAGPPRDPVLDQIGDALRGAGHAPAFLSIVTDIPLLVEGIREKAPDLVFNLAESFDDKSALDASVTALLNLLGLRYTGSSPAGMMLSGDKSLTKKVLRFHEIQVPGFATLHRGKMDWADDLTFPVIVKPPQEDGSIGITTGSVVRDLRALFRQIDGLQAESHAPVLVEEFIEGREYYVGVVGNNNAKALPIIELDFTGFPEGTPHVASWDAKWGKDGDDKGAEFAGTKSVFPADLDPDLEERMQAIAVEAFHALRLRDYARVDFRVRADGAIYVIEVNANCYLERSAEFACAAEKAGTSYDDLINRIVELASARYAR